MSDCVLKESTACVAIGNVRAMSRTLMAATQYQGSAHVCLVGQVSTAMRRALQDFMASPVSRCASARMVLIATV